MEIKKTLLLVGCLSIIITSQVKPISARQLGKLTRDVEKNIKEIEKANTLDEVVNFIEVSQTKIAKIRTVSQTKANDLQLKLEAARQKVLARPVRRALSEEVMAMSRDVEKNIEKIKKARNIDEITELIEDSKKKIAQIRKSSPSTADELQLKLENARLEILARPAKKKFKEGKEEEG